MRKPLFCVLALVALVACQKDKPTPKTSVRAIPTEAEANQFVDAYIDALYKPNAVRASQLIDWEAVLERATADIEEMRSDSWRKGVAAGAKATQKSLAENLVKNIEAGGSIAPVRVRLIDGERRAILRVLLPDGSLNYHEMPLVKDATGFVRARDIYIYAAGEYFSDTLRRLFVIGTNEEPSFLARMMGKTEKNPMIAYQPRVREMTAKIRDGDGKGALAIYESLPEALRRDKAIMLTYVMACSKIDDETHARALDDLRTAFPNDRGMEMMFIDGEIIRGRYDQAIAIVDQLDRSIGGDPYLDIMRANIRLQEGNLAQAEAMAARATERDPDLEDAWWTRVNVNLAQKDFAETARLLTHLRDDMLIEIDDLSKYPDYAEFMQTAEYRKFAR